ncbi:hypothetical protein RIF29_14266 [Crotalaria pallida]|uniref:Uncharacterized protein n=1 Tax=Crotalaria pallida TaxID=3830 RepID=A0AAN9IBF9_CROPI
MQVHGYISLPASGGSGSFIMVHGVPAELRGETMYNVKCEVLTLAVMLILILIFAGVHSGLASLRDTGEKIIGERAFRVLFTGLSLPLAVSTIQINSVSSLLSNDTRCNLTSSPSYPSLPFLSLPYKTPLPFHSKHHIIASQFHCIFWG